MEDTWGELPICRVKNKFSATAEVEDGYRDLSLSVIYTDPSGLRIIGEIQVNSLLRPIFF